MAVAAPALGGVMLTAVAHATPVTVTLTSLQSRTFSVSTTVGYASELHTTLKLNVSTTIEFSRTTAIGVNVQATVAPLSTPAR